MQKNTSTAIKFYLPNHFEGAHGLSRCVSETHADLVLQLIKQLDCPGDQKLRLIDAVITKKREQM